MTIFRKYRRTSCEIKFFVDVASVFLAFSVFFRPMTSSLVLPETRTRDWRKEWIVQQDQQLQQLLSVSFLFLRRVLQGIESRATFLGENEGILMVCGVDGKKVPLHYIQRAVYGSPYHPRNTHKDFLMLQDAEERRQWETKRQETGRWPRHRLPHRQNWSVG